MNDQDECVSNNERHHIPKQPLQCSCMNAYVFSIITMQNFYFFCCHDHTRNLSHWSDTFSNNFFFFSFLFNGFRNTRFEFLTNDFASKKHPIMQTHHNISIKFWINLDFLNFFSQIVILFFYK